MPVPEILLGKCGAVCQSFSSSYHLCRLISTKSSWLAGRRFGIIYGGGRNFKKLPTQAIFNSKDVHCSCCSLSRFQHTGYPIQNSLPAHGLILQNQRQLVWPEILKHKLTPGETCRRFGVINCLRHHCRTYSSKPYINNDHRNTPPWRILFFGTDGFSLHHLKALNENRTSGADQNVESLEVVVPAPKGSKHKSVVENYAEGCGLKVYHWPLSTMTDKYDVGVLVSFGHLIPARIINMFPHGILNVHPSFLPRWRGASPIIHTILNGDPKTGISVMNIKPKRFDVGPLLVQKECDVPEECTSMQLRDFLARHGSQMMIECLKGLITCERKQQDQKETSDYAHKLQIQHSWLNWEEQTSCDIDRQYRGLHEIYDLRTEWKGSSVKLLDMVPIKEMNDNTRVSAFLEGKDAAPAGFPVYTKDREWLCIKCRDGWVAFQRIVYKKTMSPKAFYSGYLHKPENRGLAFVSHSNGLEKYSALHMNDRLSQRLVS